MDLDSALATFDKVAVNLDKLEKVWERAQHHFSYEARTGSAHEYTNLALNWEDLLPGLLPIEGWKITTGLPDVEEFRQVMIDAKEAGVFPRHAIAESVQPGEDLAKYRHLLDRARRRVIAARLTELTERITAAVAAVVEGLPAPEEWLEAHSPNRQRVDTPRNDEIQEHLAETERLLGQTVERTGRWSEMRRHLNFGQIGDWHDIAYYDWPSVLADIDAAKVGESDPIPVPDIDLGRIGQADLTGQATTALSWPVLTPEDFERLLFDILRDLEGYQNVEWLTQTNAPDRGRDLSLQRVTHDSAGTVRTERVIVQAKHYTSRSVSPREIHDSLTALPLWEPPRINLLIIATSGRFTSDAVALAEKHNEDGNRPYIELWPDSRLEMLLAQRPKLVITHRLR